MMLLRWVRCSPFRLKLTAQIITYDGSTLRVRGTITLEQGVAAQHVLFSPAFNQIVVIAKVGKDRRKTAYIQDTMSIYEGKSSSTSEDIK
jgi:hypothetical protein